VDIPATSDNIPGTLVLRDASGNLFAGQIAGDVTGNVTGDLTGDVTGNVTGDLTGNVTGNVTGDLTGNVTGNVTGTASAIADNTVTSSKIVDGSIVDADINASAAIGLTKLATGALPAAITVDSANIVSGTIVNEDISATADIALSKLATGALPTAITVASANLVDGTIVNADINDSAAIAGSKLADASITPVKLVQPYTLATAQTASGTTIDFSSIPSWVKRIKIMFSALSFNGAAHGLVRLGSGSLVTSGYVSGSNFLYGGTSSGNITSTAGCIVYMGSAANTITGTIDVSLLTANTWVASGVHVFDNNRSIQGFTAGKVTLSGALDMLRVMSSNGTDTFDSGDVNISYEG